MDASVGKVYAVGGHDGNEHLGNMEMFDPLTNKWMMKASMNTKRYVYLCVGLTIKNGSPFKLGTNLNLFFMFVLVNSCYFT